MYLLNKPGVTIFSTDFPDSDPGAGTRFTTNY
jgi:hypothetical protein